MVPTVIVVLDALPRNDRGKVDRWTLPAPPVASTGVPTREPVGQERVVVNIMRDVLALDEVGVDDDFFELGGDSLGAIELLVAIEEQLHVRLSESILLEAPTAAELAARIDDRNPGPEAAVAVQFRAHRSDDAAPGDAFTGAPVFFVGGAGASTLMLRPLADAMAPRPFYGFQQRGLETRGRPDPSIEAAAALLSHRGPLDPAAGPLPARWVLARGLDRIRDGVPVDRRGRHRRIARRSSTRRRPALEPRSSRRSRGRVGVHAPRRAVRQAPRPGRARDDSYRDPAAHGLDTTLTHRAPRGVLCHRRPSRWPIPPAAKFPGPVLVIRADRHARHDDGGDDLGWSRWVTGPITAVGFPVDHDGVIRPPVVADLGALVRDS